MSSRFLAIVAAGLMGAPAAGWAFPAAPVERAEAALTRVQAEPDPLGVHATIEQAEGRLAEIDATISVLQKEAAGLDEAARRRAEAEIAKLRSIRDTYHAEIETMVAQTRAMTAEKVAAARAALEAPWTAFDHELDAAVAAVKLDAAQRKELVEAQLAAAQHHWEQEIRNLKASVDAVAADKRAAIEAQITELQASVAGARARITKLESAGESAWSALRRGLAESHRVFDETYGAIHTDLEKGAP